MPRKLKKKQTPRRGATYRNDYDGPAETLPEGFWVYVDSVVDDYREMGLGREFKEWLGMIGRCYVPGVPGYNEEGGKGVRVCKGWLRFENFIRDIGPMTGRNDAAQ